MARPHWRLVAPWWHWDLRESPDSGRAARAGAPVISKYGSPDFVKAFLTDPQRSLQRTEADQHHRIEPIPSSELMIGGRSKVLNRHRAIPTGTLKLFQPAHQRFYVVAFAVHCDEPGFPRVDRGGVASAGFVVRRRRVALDTGETKEAVALLTELTSARALAQSQMALDQARSRTRVLVPVRSRARRQVVSPKRATTEALRGVTTAKRALRDWADAHRLSTAVEAWVPSGEGTVGAWEPWLDQPEALTERWYPAQPLVADPNDPGHDARDATVFWGVVPTASDEVGLDGSARFDPTQLYEIRAFVKPAGDEDCPAPLVWSAPTETFRLAGFFDPVGCGQRAVDVRLPDLAELEAHLGSTQPSVRTLTPGPQLEFPKELPVSGSVGAPADEICFWFIPLITFVAMFLLNLFLPIILFAFNLWWMLKLKFCIPPSVDFEAELSAELDVVPGGFEAAFDLSLDIDIDAGFMTPAETTALRTKLSGALDDEIGPGAGAALTSRYTNDALVKMLAARGVGQPGDGSPPHGTPLPRVDRVERHEVVHP